MDTRHTRLRRFVGVAVALVIFGGTAVPAHAFTYTLGLKSEGFTYYGRPACTYGYVGIYFRQAPDQGFALTSFVEARSMNPAGFCQSYRVAKYTLARQDLYRWNGSTWTLCNQGPWVQGSYYGSDAGFKGQIWTPPNTPCGSSYYFGVGWGYKWDGSWQGGGRWTGWGWSEASYDSAAATAAELPSSPPPPPPTPEWVRADGTVDIAKFPITVQVSRSNGEMLRRADGTPEGVQTNITPPPRVVENGSTRSITRGPGYSAP